MSSATDGQSHRGHSPMIGNNNEQNNGIIMDGSNNVLDSFNVNMNSNIYLQPNPTPVTDELDQFLGNKTSCDASHHSFHPEYHRGTRLAPLEALDGWIDSHTASPILWLYGPAGVGKSVIAKATCERQANKIVASFFFTASHDKSATVLAPALARQLVHNVPDTKPRIIDALNANPSPFQCRIEDQIKRLIIGPLAATCNALPFRPIILIDGVDECTDEHGLTAFLRFLERSANSEALPVRFIICSRPEPHIGVILMKTDDHTNDANQLPEEASESHGCLWLQTIKFHLDIYMGRLDRRLGGFGSFYQDLKAVYRTSRSRKETGLGLCQTRNPDSSDDMDILFNHPVVSRIQIGDSKYSAEDINAYLTAKVELHNQFATDSRTAIERLVNNACGQFLYASTIVRLLQSGCTIAEIANIAQSSRSLSELDDLYAGILRRTTEARILKDTFSILIVFAENTQYANIEENFVVIEGLLGLEKDRLHPCFSKLHSVLNIKRGVSIAVYHRSFLEFLQNCSRSKEYSVAYPFALWRLLALLGSATFLFALKSLFGNLR